MQVNSYFESNTRGLHVFDLDGGILNVAFDFLVASFGPGCHLETTIRSIPTQATLQY